MRQQRLEQQIRFIVELDKLKGVLRRSWVNGGERLENSAEHSWHLALLAMTLAEHADAPVDVERVIKMVLIHDVVEIDTGDALVYDTDGREEKQAQERVAADRIFGMLPEDQRRELQALWEEFEAKVTPEARFAGALDRLMPLLHNWRAEGRTWKEHDVRSDQVLHVNSAIERGSAGLWAFARRIIEDSIAKGFLDEPE